MVNGGGKVGGSPTWWWHSLFMEKFSRVKSSHRCSLQAYLMAVLGFLTKSKPVLFRVALTITTFPTSFFYKYFCCNIVTYLVCANPIYDNVQREWVTPTTLSFIRIAHSSKSLVSEFLFLEAPVLSRCRLFTEIKYFDVDLTLFLGLLQNWTFLTSTFQSKFWTFCEIHTYHRSQCFQLPF